MLSKKMEGYFFARTILKIIVSVPLSGVVNAPGNYSLRV
jgi:hypothetical protein